MSDDQVRAQLPPLERARLMCSIKGRLELARLDAAAQAPPPDPWEGIDQLRPTRIVSGHETIGAVQALEQLGRSERDTGTFMALSRAMRARGWQPWRGIVGDRQASGFRRKLPDAEEPLPPRSAS